MRLTELIQRVTTPIFFDYQIERLFPQESKHQVTVQLSRWARTGILVRLKRGLYALAHAQIDEFLLANWLYRPSYVSLESALNYYGVIPDVVQNVTSVSPVTTKTIKTSRGVFMYSKLAQELYFGFQVVKTSNSELTFLMAAAEKAVLDYVYVRRIRNLTDHRLDLALVNQSKLGHYAKVFPEWVREVINE